MINTEINGTSMTSGGAPAPAPAPAPAHDNQLPEKTVLRDVQNENAGNTHKILNSVLPGLGKSNGDAIKVCGTKRLTPDRPSITHGLPCQLARNGTNENVMKARRRFDLELGRGRLYNHVEKNPDLSELKSVGQKSTQKRDGNNVPRVPAAIFSSKQVNSTTAAAAKVNGDQIRVERFVRLQKFLKHCDEANQREYVKRLLRLSPSDLNKHAVDLEKRAIQLTIDEGNEMQQMKALNILSKSSSTNSLLQSSQLLQSNKR